MSVSPEDVARIARLAEIAVTPAELPGLTAQLDCIVNFVAQLAELAAGTEDSTWQGGPSATPLREDVVLPPGLARSAAELAPEFVDGFFVVPRLGAMEQS